jgi:DMSO/TMAO reductase YedYZ heme-binding membrane subunit
MSVLLAVNEKLPWYVTRSAGWVAWALCTVAIGWGLALSSRLVRKKGAPAWLLDLHRWLGVLALAFTLVHLGALALDTYMPFTPRMLFVPFASDYKPGPVAWGIVAFYLLAAVQLTSWAMRWLPRPVWHRIHLASLPMLVGASVHGFSAGTDRNEPAIQWVVLVLTAAVLFLVWFRVLSPSRASQAEAARARAAAARVRAQSTTQAA